MISMSTVKFQIMQLVSTLLSCSYSQFVMFASFPSFFYFLGFLGTEVEKKKALVFTRLMEQVRKPFVFSSLLSCHFLSLNLIR